MQVEPDLLYFVPCTASKLWNDFKAVLDDIIQRTHQKATFWLVDEIGHQNIAIST
jgi:hypothetical protein